MCQMSINYNWKKFICITYLPPILSLLCFSFSIAWHHSFYEDQFSISLLIFFFNFFSSSSEVAKNWQLTSTYAYTKLLSILTLFSLFFIVIVTSYSNHSSFFNTPLKVDCFSFLQIKREIWLFFFYSTFST